MGNQQSRREREKQEMDRFRKRVSDGPDLRVNQSIQMFTSLSASDNLRQHYEKRKMKVGVRAADWTKSLAQKLATLIPVPVVAGLTALAIAIIIDIVSSSPPKESTEDALHSMFAEGKASEVWDQIDECLKRCVMNINNRAELVSDIKRIEGYLSAAITKLKNSMVRDGHMTSQALKAWVNGAAFHIQMLIHLVRLGGIQTCDPVERLIFAYLRDLELLFNKHKELITGKCRMKVDVLGDNRYLVDEVSKKHKLGKGKHGKYFEAYYDHRYGQQKREIHQYLSDVNQNLLKLVHQTGSFNVN